MPLILPCFCFLFRTKPNFVYIHFACIIWLKYKCSRIYNRNHNHNCETQLPQHLPEGILFYVKKHEWNGEYVETEADLYRLSHAHI